MKSGYQHQLSCLQQVVSSVLLTWHNLLLLLILLTSCSAQSTYYVTPTPSTPCPGEPCHTLSQYVADQDFNNLTVNTTMEFLPGNHTLNQTVSVINLTWIALHGDSSSLPEITTRIVCTWPAGFVFTGITELYISSLAFISCGHNDSAAVKVLSVQQSNISNCSFHNSEDGEGGGGGTLYIEESNVILTGSIFQNNSVEAGGVLYVVDSTLTVTDNTFQNNSAGYGGVLYVFDTTLTVTDNTFQNNSAMRAGGVLKVWDSTLTVTENTFQNNSAMRVGGVLNVWDSTLTVTDNTFQNNSARYGGVLNVWDSTLTVTDNTFQNNSAMGGGGGVLFVLASTLTVTDNTFQNNSAGYGGVLYVFDTTLNVTDNTFQNNSAADGGVLYVRGSTLTVTDNTFQNNSARNGGVLIVLDSTLTVTNNTFQNNSAMGGGGGGVLFVLASTLTVTDNTFQNNSARYGGVLIVLDSTLTVTDNTFQNNSAMRAGGVLAVQNSTLTVTDNNLTDSSSVLGGAIAMTHNSMVSMYGSNIIENNRAQCGGGIVALDNSQLQLFNTIFESNRASYGGGLYAHTTECNGSAIFIKNVAFEGGGIYASRSTFFWTENTTVIKNNSAINGGGLLLSDHSKLYMQPNIAVHLISNYATRTGGAIKVEEAQPLTYCISSNSACFFQIHSLKLPLPLIISNIDNVEYFFNSCNVTRIMIHFKNNSAVEAGADLYGGNVDNCTLDNIQLAQLLNYSGRTVSGYVFDVMTRSGKKPTISSDPLDICTCVNDVTDCTGSYHPDPVYPGGSLEVPVIVHGQRNGITVAVVQVIDSTNNFNVRSLEVYQNILNSCTPLKYTIQSRAVDTTQEMTLYAEGPCQPTETNTLIVTVGIRPCPPGFQLSPAQSICICAERLQQFTDTCLIDNATVLRAQDDEFWVGYDNKSQGIILHCHCPFDYCTSEETHLAVDDSDKQCNYNRSGLLCGRCSDNLSLALGSSRCLQCSNSYLSLSVVFAFAGIALVLLLLVLRLTVAAGTINGLILYANIVAVNSQIFFQHQNTNAPTVLMDKVLTLFVAWVNLDLRIETCFYNGMDPYVKTWLQFVFPLYVWALVSMITIGSYYSGRVAKVFGNNPIAVLATLFLLSYAKLLRTVIAALSYTSLEYPNNSHIPVWLYDGNIPYLGGKHIPLFTAAMVCLIVLFLPYMILLVFGQWLQAKSKFRIFSWINSPKVKPFLDAYHAPYTDKHRYWTGLMLLVRFILFLISAVNALGDPSVNLLAIVSTTVAILTLTTLSTRIYKMWSLGLLETSFTLNLAILAAATLYIRLIGGNQNAATFTSVGIAFMTFTGIVIYHAIQQIKNTPRLRKIFSKLALSPKTPGHTPEKRTGLDYEDSADRPVTAPTTTVIDLCELHSYMLREPCLEECTNTASTLTSS